MPRFGTQESAARHRHWRAACGRRRLHLRQFGRQERPACRRQVDLAPLRYGDRLALGIVPQTQVGLDGHDLLNYSILRLLCRFRTRHERLNDAPDYRRLPKSAHTGFFTFGLSAPCCLINRNSMAQLPAMNTTISPNDQGSTFAVVQRNRASTTDIDRKPTPISQREPFVLSDNCQ